MLPLHFTYASAPSGGVTDWYQSQGYREPGRISSFDDEDDEVNEDDEDDDEIEEDEEEDDEDDEDEEEDDEETKTKTKKKKGGKPVALLVVKPRDLAAVSVLLYRSKANGGSAFRAKYEIVADHGVRYFNQFSIVQDRIDED
ncbi:hypothetical protein Tco_0955521 [Tanacetum coccineum]|uniref:Uncharacterized protein n=1 Tax=Tanacetum coccineum TaxID=301880 RepID=A0ABQ5E7I1_9ASTR